MPLRPGEAKRYLPGFQVGEDLLAEALKGKQPPQPPKPPGQAGGLPPTPSQTQRGPPSGGPPSVVSSGGYDWYQDRFGDWHKAGETSTPKEPKVVQPKWDSDWVDSPDGKEQWRVAFVNGRPATDDNGFYMHVYERKPRILKAPPGPAPTQAFTFHGKTVNIPKKWNGIDWDPPSQVDIDRAEDNAYREFHDAKAEAERRAEKNAASAVKARELALNERRVEMEHQNYLDQRARQSSIDSADFAARQRALAAHGEEQGRAIADEKQAMARQNFLTWLSGSPSREPTWQEFVANLGVPREKLPTFTQNEAPWWYGAPGGATFAKRQLQNSGMTLPGSILPPGVSNAAWNPATGRYETIYQIPELAGKTEPLPEYTPAFQGAMNPFEAASYREDMKTYNASAISRGAEIAKRIADENERNRLESVRALAPGLARRSVPFQR